MESGYGWLAVVGALGSVVSLGYYLRVVVELYMRPADDARAAEAAETLPAPTAGPTRAAGTRMPLAAALGVALAGITLLLAFVPQPVFEAGCDARNELVVGGERAQVAAADDGAAEADPAAPAPAATDTAPESAG